MFDSEKYDRVFCESFAVDNSVLEDNPKYGSIGGWDSIGHVNFVIALEDAFGVEFEPEDYMEINSYERGKEVIKRKLRIRRGEAE